MRSFTRLRPYRFRNRNGSFTLLEVLITLAILLVILVVVMQFMADVDQAWKSAAADPFAEAQNAFETVAQKVASATLAPYQDYANSSGAFHTNAASNFIPDHLARRSDLDFVCGPGAGTNGLLAASGLTTTGSGVFFLAPNGYTQAYAHTGMEHLLNAMGYFVEFGDDDAAPGFILPQTHSWRWRLKQVLQPAESLQIFATTTSSNWIQQLVPPGASLPVLAENVVTLIVLPERAANDSGPALAPAYSYDSRDASNPLTLHQLPARVWLVLVAIDPVSAERLAAQNGSSPPQLIPSGLFQEPAQTNAVQQVAQLDADLATLDGSLTAQKIGHRIFQREILLPSSAWSNTPSP
jgi:uncharacterized protein (TIGR02599 family)